MLMEMDNQVYESKHLPGVLKLIAGLIGGPDVPISSLLYWVPWSFYG